MKSKQPQFYGASTTAYKNARRLRKRQTKAEEVLWQLVRNRKIANAKIRRQHPIGPFYVDFYCHEAQLVIEVDGSIHDVEEVQVYDKERQGYIEGFGITFLRFSNDEVLINPESVVKEIEDFINSLK